MSRSGTDSTSAPNSGEGADARGARARLRTFVQSPSFVTAFLCVLAIPLFFSGLDRYSLVNGDEGIYHAVAVNMVETGDWTRLDFHGQHRVYDTFMNAPLHYWARAVLISLFGDSRWTMRALSAVFGVLAVLATARFARCVTRAGGWSREACQTAALVAGGSLLTSYQFVHLHGARTGELDTIVACLFALLATEFVAVAGGAGADLRSGRFAWVPHHLLLAALLTVKLPLGLVPVVAELAVFALLRPPLRRFVPYVATGFAVVPLGLLWHASQALALGDEFTAVMDKMSGEAGGSVGVGDFTGGPLENLAWYLQKTAAGIWPWSLLVPFALVAAAGRAFFARGESIGDEPESQVPRTPAFAERLGWATALAYALATWGFFLVVAKRFPWYVMPSYPFFAAAIAGWWASLGAARRPLAFDLLAGCVLFVGIALLGPVESAPYAVRASRAVMELEWDSFADAWSAVLFWLAVGGFALLLARGGLRSAPAAEGRPLQLRRREEMRSFGIGLLFALVVVPAYGRVEAPLADLDHTSELDRLAQRLEARLEAGEPVGPVFVPESEGFLRIQSHFGRHFHVRREGGRYRIEPRREDPTAEDR